MSTGIEWTDETWNPVVGCTRVSAGCDHCYAFELHDKRYKANRDAARIAARERGLPLKSRLLTDAEQVRAFDPGPLPLPAQYDVPFSRVQLMPERLDKPLHWKKPRKVFVNSMSDLFHEDVPDEFIDRVFAVMALTPQHTYQVLTKRPERMREYVASEGRRMSVYLAGLPQRMTGDHYADSPKMVWPLPNVWLGTSVEHQAAADERIPHLLATPAAVRFLLCEPLLAPVDLRIVPNRPLMKQGIGLSAHPGIDWVIVGGESGPHARPCDVGWIRGIVSQCQAAEVPVFVKQLGSKPYEEMHQFRRAGFGAPVGLIAASEAVNIPIKLRSRHGSDPEEWPDDLRVREFPEVDA